VGRALLGRFDVTPAETLMVGDGLADLAFGRALGCHVAAAVWGYTSRAVLAAEGPDHLLESPAQILRLVRV
jgi:AHBA synthesis associated protein